MRCSLPGCETRWAASCLAFLDEKYPDHAQHEIVGWISFCDTSFERQQLLTCSCGQALLLTYHETLGIEQVPLH